MKKRLFTALGCALLLGSVCLESGCLKTPTQASYESQVPSGNYTGTFRKIHRNLNKNTYDTVSANIQLSFNTTTGFKVTGDTSTVHAGSYGGYLFTASNVYFVDKTYPTTGTPAKIHLNGYYLYYYNGTVFQMLQSPSETLSYQYDLKAN